MVECQPFFDALAMTKNDKLSFENRQNLELDEEGGETFLQAVAASSAELKKRLDNSISPGNTLYYLLSGGHSTGLSWFCLTRSKHVGNHLVGNHHHRSRPTPILLW